MSVIIVPCLITEACEYVLNFHRHNDPPQGSLFAVGASDGTNLVGVAIVGRPSGAERIEITPGSEVRDATHWAELQKGPKK